MPFTALVADDDSFALEMLCMILQEHGYQTVRAENGKVAWNLLEARPQSYDVIILDWMMPIMSGMDVLLKIKSHDVLKFVPVIFQTGNINEEDIVAGLEAGADYYLTKPYRKSILMAILKTALSGYAIYKSLWKNLHQTHDPFQLTRRGQFEFRTLKEAQTLTLLLSGLCPEPDKVAIGLWELMLNSIEHGNLGISYHEKTKLIEMDQWDEEVRRRLTLPENQDKFSTLQFESTDNEFRFIIKDCGAGFDWKSYTIPNSERAFDPNGRGINLARQLSFDHIEYRDPGNEVIAAIYKSSK